MSKVNQAIVEAVNRINNHKANNKMIFLHKNNSRNQFTMPALAVIAVAKMILKSLSKFEYNNLTHVVKQIIQIIN